MPIFTKASSPNSIAIFLGAGTRSELTNREAIDKFWNSLSAFDAKSMERAHGPDWQITIRSVATWLHADSPLWLISADRARLFSDFYNNPKIFFIIGSDFHSEPFSVGMRERKFSNAIFIIIIYNRGYCL